MICLIIVLGLGMLEGGKMKETNVCQFAQVVNSFFSIYPEKSEAELICYVELKSNLDIDAFNVWRYK